MLKLRALPILAVLLAAAGGDPAGAFQLVSPDEASASQQSARRGLRPLPDATALPRIEVESPKLDVPVVSPVNIRLKFVPKDGAAILPETFKARYGWLGIDITDRIREHAEITAKGVKVDNAELPKGQHDLTLSVRDSDDTTTERELSVTVQ